MVKVYKATKHRPRKHPTTIELWSGNVLMLRLWVTPCMEVEATPNGPKEVAISVVHCESSRFKVHQPARIPKDDTGWYTRKLFARVMLWDCFGEATAEKFADAFGRMILLEMPTSTWRFDEASLMAGILECRKRSADLMKLMDVSNP